MEREDHPSRKLSWMIIWTFPKRAIGEDHSPSVCKDYGDCQRSFFINWGIFFPFHCGKCKNACNRKGVCTVWIHEHPLTHDSSFKQTITKTKQLARVHLPISKLYYLTIASVLSNHDPQHHMQVNDRCWKIWSVDVYPLVRVKE